MGRVSHKRKELVGIELMATKSFAIVSRIHQETNLLLGILVEGE
jgi:hypothetical protein